MHKRRASYSPYDMDISNYYHNKFLLVNFNAESDINFFGKLNLQNYPQIIIVKSTAQLLFFRTL